MKIKGEDELIFKSILDGLKVKYVREYKFNPTTNHRFDFALLDKKIAFEIDGGIYGVKVRQLVQGRVIVKTHPGRHTSPVGYQKDCIKQVAAVKLKWYIVKIPVPWLHHHHPAKPQKHLMYYSEVVQLVKDLTT